jgi:hypothetical protein
MCCDHTPRNGPYILNCHTHNNVATGSLLGPLLSDLLRHTRVPHPNRYPCPTPCAPAPLTPMGVKGGHPSTPTPHPHTPYPPTPYPPPPSPPTPVERLPHPPTNQAARLPTAPGTPGLCPTAARPAAQSQGPSQGLLSSPLSSLVRQGCPATTRLVCRPAFTCTHGDIGCGVRVRR